MTRSISRDEDRFCLKSIKYPSERISGACLREACTIGIDEAGRGPVLGPLVYAIFASPDSLLPWLRENGANDSKLLTEELRERFFDLLLNSAPAFSWSAKALHPEYISNCMLLKAKYNLNELSYDTVFSIITSLLDSGIVIKEAFVDTLGKPEKYQARLTERFPGIKFTVRSKADALFPVVGAASIVAKILRDDILRHTLGVGASGYPGDSATVAWLKDHLDPVFGFPRIVRFSWGTSREFVDKHCLAVRWIDDIERSEGKEGQENTLQTNGRAKRSVAPERAKTITTKAYFPFGMTSDASRSC